MAYRDWRLIRCVNCSGYGQVSAYTLDGSDFLGPEECRECGGSGQLWISPKDRIADYPGGPFRGSWPGAYAEACSPNG